MSATLHYEKDGKAREVACKSIVTIGRDSNSDIVLKDLTVSRNHAMVRRIGHDDYYLIDSGSANGSTVNGSRIAMPTLLKNGDLIKVGDLDISFDQQQKVTVGHDSISMVETVISSTPEINKITIMVADIRGFTALSEQVHIRTLTQMMNAWFSGVSDIIFKNGGLVDKFIGDCVFARWEAKQDDKVTIYRILQAALEISEITSNLNNDFPEVTENIRIGVGVNSGAATLTAGQDNSALGDAVNLAFRLESATKVIRKDMVLSENAYTYLPEQYWKGKELHIRVKGKRDPIRIVGIDFIDVKNIVKGVAG